MTDDKDGENKALEVDPAAKRPRVPTLEQWDIRIARDGTWFHEGQPIRREGLVRLFATVLKRDEAGTYWLETPVERGEVVVEDAPFLAVEVTIAGEGRNQTLTFRTNIDETVTADASHPIRIASDSSTGSSAPYILVRDRLEAKIVRSVYYELVARAETWEPNLPSEEETTGIVGVWSSGRFFPLGPTS